MTASTVLPIMGYLAGILLVAYIAIRAYRHVKLRNEQSVVLPRPVYETVPKRSLFSFARAKGRNGFWHLPWTRFRAGPSWKNRSANITSAKNLSLELLPTTALPPPPDSIPTSPPIVDLANPLALEALSSTRFSSSLPSSPKQQSHALLHQSSSPNLLKTYRNVQHPAFPRPLSPHALLATTSPQRQKRSRSLGGVPVRRLSSGQSGLRNSVDVELREFSLGHSRTPSEEHPLIDFSSDDQVSEQEGLPSALVAAAISPSRNVNENMWPRPPLVDIQNDLNSGSANRKLESEDTAWMWFSLNPPSTVRMYDTRVLTPQPRAAPFAGEKKFAFPLPLSFPVSEKFLSEDQGLQLQSLDTSKTLVEVENDPVDKNDPISLHEMSEEGCSPKNIAVDPFSDAYAIDNIQAAESQFDNPGYEHQIQDSPLVDKSKIRKDFTPPSPYVPLVDVDETQMESSPEAGIEFPSLSWVSVEESPLSTVLPVPPVSVAGFVSSATPLPQTDQSDWGWIEADDPWDDRLRVQDTTSTPLVDEVLDVDVDKSHLDQEQQGDLILTEKSPSGSLLATVLGADADDEVPHLILDNPSPTEEVLVPLVRKKIEDEEEEDATPRPTPVSIDINLPGSDIALPIVPETESHPDPDLLPLPEFNFPSNKSKDPEAARSEPRPSSQMPTPPASPPLPSSALFNSRKVAYSRSPSPTSRKAASGIGITTRHSRSPSPLALRVAPPIDGKQDNLMWDISLPVEMVIPGGFTEEIRNDQDNENVEDIFKEAMDPNDVEVHKEAMSTEVGEDEDEILISDPSLTTSVATSEITSVVAVALTEKVRPGPASFHPSVRAIIRQPVEIALAMQLRPGLGAGADPAWMVRFLMSMFGWFAVLVSGQENY